MLGVDPARPGIVRTGKMGVHVPGDFRVANNLNRTGYSGRNGDEK